MTHPGRDTEMAVRYLERSGGPETSYAETSLGDRVTNEDMERRLSALRNPTTGLLDTKEINPRENPLREEDKTKEINNVKAFIKSLYPNANIEKMEIKFSKKKTMDIVIIGPSRGETKILLDNGSGFRNFF